MHLNSRIENIIKLSKNWKSSYTLLGLCYLAFNCVEDLSTKLTLSFENHFNHFQTVHSLKSDNLAAHGRFQIESIRYKITQKEWHLYKIFLQSANSHIHSVECSNEKAKIVWNNGDIFKHLFTSWCAAKSSLFIIILYQNIF